MKKSNSVLDAQYSLYGCCVLFLYKCFRVDFVLIILIIYILNIIYIEIRYIFCEKMSIVDMIVYR